MKKINLMILLVCFWGMVMSQSVELSSEKIFESLDEKCKSGEFKEISSIIVSRKGNLIYNEYYNGSNSETLHNTRSATKSITNMLIGLLISDGLLTSEYEFVSPIVKPQIDYYSDSRKDSIKVVDLLTMSSCLECDDWNNYSRGHEEKMYIVEDWNSFFWNLPIKGFPAWVDPPEKSPYGRSFSYCTAGTVVLGDVIQKLTGSIEKYTEERLFHPLGITNCQWQYIPTGNPMTGGGLGLRSMDLMKLASLYLQKGMWYGKEIIDEEWVDKSTMKQAFVNYGSGYSYGYLWWISEFDGEEAFYMSGTGGNKVLVFKDLDLVVVVTSQNYGGGGSAHQEVETIISDYIIKAVKHME